MAVFVNLRRNELCPHLGAASGHDKRRHFVYVRAPLARSKEALTVELV